MSWSEGGGRGAVLVFTIVVVIFVMCKGVSNYFFLVVVGVGWDQYCCGKAHCREARGQSFWHAHLGAISPVLACWV